MVLDLRSLREWLLVALHRGRLTGPGTVGREDLSAWHEAGGLGAGS